MAQIVAASTFQFQEHRWKMIGSTCRTRHLPMNMMKLAAQCSGGRRHSRPAVGPSAGAPPSVVMAGAVASPGKQMLLARRHPPAWPGSHLPSLGWPSCSRAGIGGGVVASAATSSSSSSRQAKEEDRASRNVSGFQPSIWGDFFLTYSSPLATSSAQKVGKSIIKALFRFII